MGSDETHHVNTEKNDYHSGQFCQDRYFYRNKRPDPGGRCAQQNKHRGKSGDEEDRIVKNNSFFFAQKRRGFFFFPYLCE